MEGSNSWGRGLCWFFKGISSAIVNGHIDNYIRLFNETASRLLSGQDEKGYLFNDVNTLEHIDTSTTSMAFASILKVCINDDGQLKKYYENIKKGITALTLSTNDLGEVLDCSGECETADCYSSIYGNYFAQYFTVYAFDLFLEVEINSVLDNIKK